MTALFTIVESYRADLDALNAMDIDAATYADTLDGMQGELQDKLRAVIAYSLDLEIEATGAAAASKRMKERAESIENRVKMAAGIRFARDGSHGTAGNQHRRMGREGGEEAA